MRPERTLLVLATLAAANAAAADIDGLALGMSEAAVRQRLPNAHCQPLQWQSLAADRRCDDSRVKLANVDVRVTLYLKHDATEGFDVRFESRYAARLAKLVSERFGTAPLERTNEKTVTHEWRAKGEQALLTTQPGERRASLIVWRGAFYDEIYKVR